MVASKAKSKGTSIVLQVEPDLPLVHANGGELNQVWLNLIDNALDAISEGGRVEVSVRRELQRVVVQVVDDGPGISPDVLPHIFDPFFTTKPPGQGNRPGPGNHTEAAAPLPWRHLSGFPRGSDRISCRSFGR